MTDDGYNPEKTKRVLAGFPIRKRPDREEVPGPEAYDPERFSGPPGMSFAEAWRFAHGQPDAMGAMTRDQSMRRLHVEHGLLDGSVTVDAFAPHVDVVPGRMSGAPCFCGTRVTLETLLANLDEMTVDQFLAEFETVQRADLLAVLAVIRGEAS